MLPQFGSGGLDSPLGGGQLGVLLLWSGGPGEELGQGPLGGGQGRLGVSDRFAGDGPGGVGDEVVIGADVHAALGDRVDPDVCGFEDVLDPPPGAQPGDQVDAQRGPLALVRSGDLITLDVPRRRIELKVSPDVLAERRAAWRPRAPHYEPGWGKLYSTSIRQANEGCDLDFLEAGAPTPEPAIH